MIDEKPIKTTVEELRKLIHISNYVGEPIESEDKILIPVTKAAVGFGIGEQKTDQTVAATGAGVSVVTLVLSSISHLTKYIFDNYKKAKKRTFFKQF